jgi:class 3 adenylate cyclase/tetratricopeptide (TPR) repeat protein
VGKIPDVVMVSPQQHEVRKTVTVVFCDITGSTALGESIDSESVRGVMSRYVQEMRTVLERYGSTMEKFIGDAVMAVFGIPLAHEDDALRAVSAALDMNLALGRVNAELKKRWGVELQARIGVNTGEVVAGAADQGESFVTGDSVNIAARLQQAAGPGEILIGPETHRLVRDAIEVEPVEPLALKGKSSLLVAYRLNEVRHDARRLLRRSSSPMVGRAAELQQLEEALQRARRGTCQLITLIGPAGIGKSRLCAELTARLGDEAWTLEASCPPYGDALTFWPLREIVADAAGLTEQDSPEEVRARIAALFPDEAEDASLAAARVAEAFGMGEGATGDIQHVFWAFRRLFEALATERLLVVVLDDVHWAEEALLDLLEYVSRGTSGHRMLILCTSRPDLLDARPHWGRGQNGFSSVTLDALTESATESMIRAVLRDGRVPDHLIHRLSGVAGGNPLYVEELSRMLVEDGLLALSEGAWAYLGDSGEIPVPPSLGALIGARIDHLEPSDKTVLEHAAVVGDEFWPSAVAELSPELAPAEIDSSLETLVSKELIVPGARRFAQEDGFSFGHQLVREVAYTRLLKQTRSELHVRFANWLERAVGDRATEYGELIGFHLERAYQYRKALGPLDSDADSLADHAAANLGSAGGSALARGDADAAVSLLQRAIALLPADYSDRAGLSLKLGFAHAQSGQLTRAHSLLRERLQTERRGKSFLTYRNPAGKEQIHDLDDETSPVTIGRLSSNDVSLAWDTEVSRRHAQLELVEGAWSLFDDGISRNGSYVKGERVSGRVQLRDGDVLRFGDTVMLFRSSLSTPPPRADAGLSSVSISASDLPGATHLADGERSIMGALGRHLRSGEDVGRFSDGEISTEVSLRAEDVSADLTRLAHRFELGEEPRDRQLHELAKRALALGL